MSLLLRRRGVLAGGGFSPRDIADLTGWWKADAITPQADNTALTTWPDSSGLGRDLVPWANPLYYRTNVRNGLPATEGGSMRGMTIPKGNEVAFVGADGSWTAFGVGVRADTVDARCLVDGDDNRAGGNRVSQFIRTNGGVQETLSFSTTGVVNTDTQGTGFVVGTWYVFESVRTTTTIEALRNGVGNGATALTGTPKSGAGRVCVGNRVDGGGQPWVGHIGEAIIYGRALSSGERTQVRDYLTAKWAI